MGEGKGEKGGGVGDGSAVRCDDVPMGVHRGICVGRDRRWQPANSLSHYSLKRRSASERQQRVLPSVVKLQCEEIFHRRKSGKANRGAQ
jgi:hypothetical protein